MLAEVADAIEVLAGGALGGEGPGALVVFEVAEGALFGLGEADHVYWKDLDMTGVYGTMGERVFNKA
jgi:hypothetical protein